MRPRKKARETDPIKPGGSSLAPLRKEMEQRKKAKEDVQRALLAYLEDLPRSPQELPNEIVELARIWGAYAGDLYDSLAERYNPTSHGEIDTLFGESGELFGGITIARLAGESRTLRLRPNNNWPRPNFSQEGDSLESIRTWRELSRALSTGPYSFNWLLGDEWFMNEIKSHVGQRAMFWRKRFEDKLRGIRAPDDLRTLRRQLLTKFKAENGIDSQTNLARHLGVSVSALQGITRGDRNRFGVPTLLNVLAKIKVSPEKWDDAQLLRMITSARK